jgi:hypothetical protein
MGVSLVTGTLRFAVLTACGLVWSLFASAPLLATDAGMPVSASAPEPGIWQEHKYSFLFMGFTSTYSCDGLASKLKLLLIASGARADVKSRAGACASFGQPDKFARAELTFYTLAPPDPEKPITGPIVDGIWRPVALASRKPQDLRIGDCELVEQFKSNVLPMFTTRNIEGQISCIPHQLSGSQIDLRFDAFAGAPHKK